MNPGLSPTRSSPLLGLPEVFERLRPADRETLERHARLITLPRNTHLFSAGDPVDHTFVMRTGLIGYTLRLPDGRDEVPDFFRAQEILTPVCEPGAASPLDAVSVGGAATAVSWPTMLFRGVMLSDARLALWFCDQLAERQRLAYLRRSLYATLRRYPERRLASFYLQFAEKRGDGRREMTLKVPQQMIAAYIGVRREEVSRKKQQLERMGYLTTTPSGGLAFAPNIDELTNPPPGALPPWLDTHERQH